MRKSLIAFALVFSSPFILAQSKDEVAVRHVLTTQVEAWNTGSIEKFMQGYWKSDSVMFIGKSGLTYGWQEMLDDYKKHYPDKAAMGKLAFHLLELTSLSSRCYFVVGKWHLQRSAGDLEGYFSLLFKKINGNWVIVTDHTS